MHLAAQWLFEGLRTPEDGSTQSLGSPESANRPPFPKCLFQKPCQGFSPHPSPLGLNKESRIVLILRCPMG